MLQAGSKPSTTSYFHKLSSIYSTRTLAVAAAGGHLAAVHAVVHSLKHAGRLAVSTA